MKVLTILLISLTFVSCVTQERKIKKQSKVSLGNDFKKVSKMGHLIKKMKTSDARTVELLSKANPQFRNREVVSGKPGEIEYFTTYLGMAECKGKTFHVFKCFYTVQAAMSRHGHSELIFVSDSVAYCFDMNGELPVDLISGNFRYVVNQDTVFTKVEYFSGKDLVLSNN